jgi:hypothetical protein
MKIIPIAGPGGISDHCKGLLNQLMRETVLTIDKKVKQESPVDTGRFRMSWQVGENIASGGVASGPLSKSVVPSIDRLNYLQEKIGNEYHIHNNLPYAEPLAQGHSDQAPPGWIDLIAKEEGNRMKRNWNKIVGKN